MKVRDLFNPNVPTVTRTTSLARAGSLLRRIGTGALPVVDRADRVVGLITEREALLELTRRDVAPSEVPVEDVMIERPALVEENDDALRALDLLKRERLPLLPVVNREERLVGTLSIEDLACQAAQGALPAREIAEAICDLSRSSSGETGGRSSLGRRERGAGSRERETGTKLHTHDREERVTLTR